MMFACRSGSKYSVGRRGMPEWRSASKYSSGRPARPVWSSRWQSSVLPLRGVAQTRYERSGGIVRTISTDSVEYARGWATPPAGTLRPGNQEANHERDGAGHHE